MRQDTVNRITGLIVGLVATFLMWVMMDPSRELLFLCLFLVTFVSTNYIFTCDIWNRVNNNSVEVMKKIKAIRIGEELKVGFVEYHRNLIPKSKISEKVEGGFNISIDRDNETVTIYGQSDDFGKVDPNWLRNKLKLKSFRKDIIDQLYWYHINIPENYKFVFGTSIYSN